MAHPALKLQRFKSLAEMERENFNLARIQEYAGLRFEARLAQVLDRAAAAASHTLRNGADLDERGQFKINALNQALALNVTSDISRILREAGYDDLVNEHLQGYEALYGQARKIYEGTGVPFAFDQQDIEHLQFIADADATYFGRLPQMGVAAVEKALMESVLTGANFQVAANAIQAALGAEGSTLARWAFTYANDSLLNYSAAISAVRDKKHPPPYYYYAGTIIKTSRPFCIVRAGKVWSAKEVKSWEGFDWQGKKPGPFLVTRGGWNCRHSMVGVTAAWAAANDIEPELLPPPPVPVPKRRKPPGLAGASYLPDATRKSLLNTYKGPVTGLATPPPDLLRPRPVKRTLPTPLEVSPKDFETYQDKTGLGPCGPIAKVLRDLGYGEIEYGFYGPKGDYEKSFGHYWIKTPAGKIIDISNPYKGKKGWTYWEKELMPRDQHPDPNLWGKSDYDFWSKRLKFQEAKPPKLKPADRAMKKVKGLEILEEYGEPGGPDHEIYYKSKGILGREDYGWWERRKSITELAYKELEKYDPTTTQALKKRLNLKTIAATQQEIVGKTLEAAIRTPQALREFQLQNYREQGMPDPVIVKDKGKYYVLDGHHRLAAKWALGKKSAEVIIIDADKLLKPVKPPEPPPPAPPVPPKKVSPDQAYRQAQEATAKFADAQENPHFYNDYRRVRKWRKWDRDGDPLKAKAWALHQAEHEARIALYESLDFEGKNSMREATVRNMVRIKKTDPAIKANPNLEETKIRHANDGTSHITYRMLADLERNDMRIVFRSDLKKKRAYYDGKGERGEAHLDWGDSSAVIAHEMAHAIDSFMSGGARRFPDSFGYWKTAALNTYTDAKAAKQYRNWYGKNKTGGEGKYSNGDGYYHLGNWISNYEGRIYKGSKLEGTEWFSTNAQRYSEYYRYGFGLRNWKRDAAIKDWNKVKKRYPELAEFIEKFYNPPGEI